MFTALVTRMNVSTLNSSIFTVSNAFEIFRMSAIFGIDFRGNLSFHTNNLFDNFSYATDVFAYRYKFQRVKKKNMEFLSKMWLNITELGLTKLK